VEGEEDQFDRMLHTLLLRRRKLPALLELSRTGIAQPFPLWTA